MKIKKAKEKNYYLANKKDCRVLQNSEDEEIKKINYSYIRNKSMTNKGRERKKKYMKNYYY